MRTGRGERRLGGVEKRPCAVSPDGGSERTFGAALAALGLAAVLIGLSAGTALGEFQEPVRISGAAETVGDFQAGLDFFENFTYAYDTAGKVLCGTRHGDVTSTSELAPGEGPGLAFNSVGVYVAFSGTSGRTDLDILVAYRSGSRWSQPESIATIDGDDRYPVMQLWDTRTPVVVWENYRPGPGATVWFRRGTQRVVEIGRGEKPTLVLDKAGRAHVFFLRSGDILYCREELSTRPGEFTTPVNVTNTPAQQESSPRAVMSADQVVYLCYERGGAILLASNAGGGFGPPSTVAWSGASNPSLTLSPGEAMAVAFEQSGDIYVAVGSTFSLAPAVAATKTPQVESRPVVLLDSFASIFVAFERDGALYYSTDAGIPQARFSASTTRGEAPLEVRFSDESTGAVTSWTWDFGDDQTSRDRNPTHVYETSGTYVASLRVSGPGGESPIEFRRTILVLAPGNEMRVADVKVLPGQRGVSVPVLATHKDPAQGYTVTAVYDPELIEVTGVDYDSSNIAWLEPELFAVDISRDPQDPYVTVGILFDVAAPIEGKVMPPSRGARILSFLVDVPRRATPGTTARIELRNQVGHPPLNNIVTVNGFSILPILADGGRVEIAHLSFPPPGFFRRGDTDGNDYVNITDAIAALNYLFVGGREPDCHDAADVTDDGLIDITDAVFLLTYLFKGGVYPPPPFPEPGLDPSDDALKACLLR